MSPDDTSAVQAGDPVAVILARMEVKLDNALTEQARHGSRLDQHGSEIDTLKQDVAVIKAAGMPDRLTRVESRIYMAAGFAAALGAGGGVGLTRILGG